MPSERTRTGSPMTSGMKRHAPADDVLEHDLAVRGHAQADDRTLARGDARGRRVDARSIGTCRHIAAAGPARAAPDDPPPAFPANRSSDTPVRRRAAAGVIARRCRSRSVCRYGPSEPPTSTPSSHVEPHPSQVLDDGALAFTRGPLDVGVLDTKDERALAVPREQPVEQGRARVADVQVAGGRWSKTDTHRSRIRDGRSEDRPLQVNQ